MTLPADQQQIDHTGYVFTFRDEAPEPDRVWEGARSSSPVTRTTRSSPGWWRSSRKSAASLSISSRSAYPRSSSRSYVTAASWTDRHAASGGTPTISATSTRRSRTRPPRRMCGSPVRPAVVRWISTSLYAVVRLIRSTAAASSTVSINGMPSIVLTARLRSRSRRTFAADASLPIVRPFASSPTCGRCASRVTKTQSTDDIAGGGSPRRRRGSPPGTRHGMVDGQDSYR